jgi:hypothetical protein
LVGCKEDDLRVLIAKLFIISFESGVVVIRHWHVHNYIAKDRYTETKCKAEKAMLTCDENNVYTTCKRIVGISAPQRSLGEGSLGEGSLGEGSLGEGSLGEGSLGEGISIAVSPPIVSIMTPSQRPENVDPLYFAIWDSCLSIAKRFTDYGREGTACKRLCEMIRNCALETPEDTAKGLLETFRHLREKGNNFWSSQPFTPSTLASAGIFDRVLIEYEKAHAKADKSWINNLEERAP